MSKVISFPDIDKMEEAACDWIARMDSGNWSESDSHDLREWLQEDPRHEDVLLEIATLLDQMSVVSSLKKLLPLSEVSMESEPLERGTRITLFPAASALVATLIIGVVIYFGVDGQQSQNPVVASYQTGIGEVRQVEINDGSRITLNTDSDLEVQLSDEERRVVLNQGEAMFQVEHDAQRPFVVEAKGYEIKAVGTAFNVDFDGALIEVTVTEGVVEVIHAGTGDRLLRTSGSVDQIGATRLIVGESLRITDTERVAQAVSPEELDARLSWREGELVFRGEPLEYVVAEVSRYSQISIVIEDDSIRDIAVGGVFKIGEIDDLIDTLEHGFGITAERSSKSDIQLRSVDANSGQLEEQQ